jgi:hypothetical protein
MNGKPRCSSKCRPRRFTPISEPWYTVPRRPRAPSRWARRARGRARRRSPRSARQRRPVSTSAPQPMSRRAATSPPPPFPPRPARTAIGRPRTSPPSRASATSARWGPRVLHHARQRHAQRDRDTVDLAHLRDGDPRHRVGVAFPERGRILLYGVGVQLVNVDDCTTRPGSNRSDRP